LTQTSAVIDLGFVATRVPHGSHICQVYSSDAERDDALKMFLLRGLAVHEATACFSDVFDLSAVAPCFAAEGISLKNEQELGRFVCSGAEAVYFDAGTFEPERMYRLLVSFYERSTATGCSGARVIGEMSPSILKIKGGARLFEYEAGINSMLRDYPMTAVCQYDARRFDGATIMDVLSVHPLMFIHGSVIQNPFFVPPEQLVRH
jgi:hypothetical protein